MTPEQERQDTELTESEQALKERMQSAGAGIAKPLPEGHNYPDLEIEEIEE